MTYLSKNDKVYNAWRKMHVRCNDRDYHSYHRYGGRGIYVAAIWSTYAEFKNDMWDSWFEGATIDRINNNGPYAPENCVWASLAENKKPFKYDVQEMLRLYKSGLNQFQLAAKYGINQAQISRHLKRARSDQKL